MISNVLLKIERKPHNDIVETQSCNNMAPKKKKSFDFSYF
jgi:hypothetical protein